MSLENLPYIPDLPCSTWATRDELSSENSNIRRKNSELKAKVAELDSVIAEQAAELAKRQDQIVIDEQVIAELSEENEEINKKLLVAYTDSASNFNSLQERNQQLAASQAREKGLRDALDDVRSDLWLQIESRRGPKQATEYPSVCKADKAISMPSDDTALREYCAVEIEKEREECAKVCNALQAKQNNHAAAYGFGYLTYDPSDCAEAIRARADKIRKGEAL